MPGSRRHDIDGWRAAASAGSAAFDAAVEEFLALHAAPRTAEQFAWGSGSDDVSLFDETSVETERAEIEAARAWQRTLYDAGAGWLSGPREFGGAELDRIFEHAWRAREKEYAVASRAALGIGTSMVGPTIERHGSPRAKSTYLSAIYQGAVIACELFSEPGAGSDLASVRTRAVRDGSRWIINGQKVWTSGAHYSDVGQALCRTDPDAAKHHGTTVLLIDMHAPGVTIRPLRQMTGGARFNEVFLDDVVVEDDMRLGAIDDGWAVTRTTLLFERLSIAAGEGRANTEVFRPERLIELLRHLGLASDPVHRQRLADLFVHVEVAALATRAASAAIAPGAPPGPELAAGKLALTENYRRLAAFVSAALGQRLTTDTGEWGTFAWSNLVLGSVGFSIAGGTDEIIRTLIGERVLGLPRER